MLHRSFAFILLAIFSGAYATSSHGAPSSVPGSVGDTLDVKLKAFLAGSKKNLGPLQPWQNKIFDEEAVPQYQRFITDYRQDYRATSSGGVDAQVDYESLRQYLRFYGPSALKQKTPSIVVVLFPQVDCAKCVAGTEQIRTLVRERLANRGLTAEWASPIDLGITSLAASNSEVVDTASRFAEVKKSSGSLVVRWGVAPNDEVDSAHADETRYEVYTHLKIRDLAQHDGSLELLEAGSFDRSVGKLLTDAFTDLGAKVKVGEGAVSEGARDEALIWIQGNWTYAQYSKLRDSLTEGLQSLGEMSEREVSRGHAVFVLYSAASAATVGEKALSIPLNDFKLSLSSAGGGSASGANGSGGADAHTVYLNANSSGALH